MHGNHDNNIHIYEYIRYIKWLTDAPFRMKIKEQAIQLLPGSWIKVSLALASKLGTNQRIYHLQSKDANAFRRTESASRPKQSSSLAFGRRDVVASRPNRKNRVKDIKRYRIPTALRIMSQKIVTGRCGFTHSVRAGL